MAKKKNLARRVNTTTRVNGQIALEMRMKSPRASISKDRKKEKNKRQCRCKVSFFCAFSKMASKGNILYKESEEFILKKLKVKGIAVEDRVFDYSIKIGKDNPIYQFSTNKFSNFVNNFKYLKGYCDKGLLWKVHIVNENYFEKMTMDNYQNMLSRVQAN